MSDAVRVLVVDDHPIVRAGLVMVVQAFDDLEVAGEAINGEDAIRVCQQLVPDVVLMDVRMGIMDGLEATRIIHQAQPEIAVIILTSFGDEDLMNQALVAGAFRVLPKESSVHTLVEAIRAAAQHKGSSADRGE